MIRALLFDFDGMIIDSESPLILAWQEIYRDYNCPFPLETFLELIGRTSFDFNPATHLIETAHLTCAPEELLSRFRPRHVALVEAQPLLPGVAEKLREAHDSGLKLAIVSSSSRRWVEGHLRRLNLLPFITLTRCRDDVGKTKPDPELYLSALAGLQVNAGQAIAFEDSYNGLLSAKRAGVYTVVVPGECTRHMCFDEADAVFPSLADVDLDELTRRLS